MNNLEQHRREVDQRLADEIHARKLAHAEATLLANARKGDLKAVQWLLRYLSEAIRDRVRLPPELASYLATALMSIYAGSTADEAFKVKRKRGGRDTREVSFRDWQIADCIEGVRERDSVTVEAARALVAAYFKVPEDTAHRAWKKNHKEAKRLRELHRQDFGQEMPIIWP